MAASAPGVAKLAGLGSKVGGALGPRASAAKEALSKLVLSKVNPAFRPGAAWLANPVAGTVASRIPTLTGRVAGGLGTAGGAVGRTVGPYLPGAGKLAIGEEALRKLLGDLQKIPIPYVKEPWGASYGRIDNPLE